MHTRKMTMSGKIIVGFCLLNFVLVSVVGCFIYKIRWNYADNEIRGNLQQLSETAASSLDNSFNSLHQALEDTRSAGGFSEAFYKFYLNGKDEESKKELLSMMVDAYKNKVDVRRVILVNTNYDYVSTGKVTPNINTLQRICGYIKSMQFKSIERSSVYYPMTEDYMDIESDSKVFTEGITVQRFGEVIGYILVQQNVIYTLNASNLNINGYKTNIEIIWNENQLLYSDINDNGRAKRFIDDSIEYSRIKETPDDIYTIYNSNYRNIRYLFILSKAVVNNNVKDILFNLFILAAVIICTTIVYLIFFVRYMIRPLHEIVRLMSRLDFDETEIELPNIKPSDLETEILFDSYVEMLKRQRDVREKKKKMEELQKKTLFSVLQSEISPHFLFNTLGGIAIMCEENRAKEAAENCYNLSDILRYSSNYATEEVILKQEEQNLTAYLELMKMRYRDRLEYEINIQDRCRYLYLPKLTLQPLVENAIKYSLLGSESVFIRIKAEMSDPFIILSVSDNGVGITEEAIELVRDRVKKIEDEREFQEIIEQTQIGNMGLSGTIIRLKLFYKETFRYELENNSGGTVVKLIIAYKDFI